MDDITTGQGQISFEGLTPEQILKALDTGWPWPMDAVQEWFESLWNEIQDWVSSGIRRVTDFLSDTASEFWQILISWFNTVQGAITSRISELWGDITSKLDWLWESAIAILNSVQSLATEIWQTVSTGVVDFAGSVGDSLSGWIASIGAYFQGGVNYLGTYIEEAFDWVGDRVSAGVATIRQEIADPITDFFTDLPERIGRVLEPIIDPFRFAYQFWEWFFQGNPGEKVAYGLSQSFQWVSDKVVPFMEEKVNDVISYIEGFAPISPAKSKDMAKGLLALGAGSVGGLAAMTIAGEIMHPLKQMGMGHIAAMVGDVVNYRMISGIIIGAFLTSGLRTPLNYYINSLLRPWLLSPRDFMELMSRRAFTEPEVLMGPEHAARFLKAVGDDGDKFANDMIGYQGYPAEYRAIFDELANTRIGYFALAAVARDGTFDKEWFTESLHRAGYSERVVQRLLDMYQRAAAEKSQGQFASTAFKRFREGITELPGFRQELEVFRYGPDKIDGFAVAATLDRETDEISSLISAYRSSFRRGKITPDQFREGLSGLGLTPLRIDVYLEEERVWRGSELAPESEETLKGSYAATAIRAYKEGFYTHDQLTSTLETLSYQPIEIDQLTIRGNLEYQLDFALDLLGAYRDAYKKDIITEDQFRQALLGLGMIPDRVDGWVFRENIRKFPTKK